MDLNSQILKLRDMFKSFNYQLYLVGGCVRDSIMGSEPHDWDMCTNAKPDEIVTVLTANNVNYHTVGIDFGTVTAILDGVEYEITTFRKETGYSDSRHPDEVVWVDNIYEDLSRRDFTINAIAYDLINEEFADPYNGIKDIENGVLRSVGEPHSRFNEDALRIMRGIRFAIKYDLHISSSLSVAIVTDCHLLSNVSKERITDELSKILSLNKPVAKYFIRYVDVICTIIPEMEQVIGVEHNNKYHQHNIYEHILAVVDLCDTDDWIIKLAALLHDIGKPQAKVTGDDGWSHYYNHPEISWQITKEIIKKDLVLTNEQSSKLLGLVRYHDIQISETDKAVKRALNKYDEDFLIDWFILKRADQDDHIVPPDCKADWRMNIDNLIMIMNNILASNQCFKLKDMKLNGVDVMNTLNIKPSKRVGEILKNVFDAVLDGTLENSHEVLIDYIKNMEV